MQQQTIGNAFELSGIGIHTGAVAGISVQPAPPDAGRVFRCGTVTIPARVEYVVDTTRCTTLGLEGVRLSTVEHLLSALAGLGIDNCIVDVDGPEIPILDGSALPFVRALLTAGIVAQDAPARVITVREQVSVGDGPTQLSAEPADAGSMEVSTEFAEWPQGAATVHVSLSDGLPAAYADAVAPARTFAFRREVDMLIAAGLAKGGSLDNALIIEPPDRYSAPLRVPTEWCAHKALDLIGDLALLDARIEARIRAVRPGHRLNTALAAALAAQQQKFDTQEKA